MKYLIILLTAALVSLQAQAGNVFTTPYSSIGLNQEIKSIKGNSNKVENIARKVTLLKSLIKQVTDVTDPTEAYSLVESQMIQPPSGITEGSSPEIILQELKIILSDLQVAQLESVIQRDKEGEICPNNKFCKIVFSPDQEGFGDIALNPFGSGTDYKINILNYSMFLGDEYKIPFQLYVAEKSAEGSPEDKNNNSLLDPTDGFSIQFPLAYRYGGAKNGICHFEVKNGHCILGGDFTFRYLELEEQSDSTPETEKNGVFGASIGLGASFMFPIFRDSITQQAGHFSLAANLRYYYHNHDDSSLLFGEILDASGNPVEFDKSFSAASIHGEFAINERFAVKLDFFSPLSNRSHLSEELNISFVLRGS